MSPRLELGVSIPTNVDQKFVRKGENIAFEDRTEYNHKDIAEKYDLLNSDGKVDDAGSIHYMHSTNTYTFIGNSMGLIISGDVYEAREKTGETAKTIIGNSSNIKARATKA